MAKRNLYWAIFLAVVIGIVGVIGVLWAMQTWNIWTGLNLNTCSWPECGG